MYPPRKGDLPRDELLKRATEAAQQFGGNVLVFFKFTCEHCGERNFFEEPGHLYESGTCEKCGKETIIKFGGFALDVRFGTEG